MTMLEVYTEWATWVEAYGLSEETINDFCNTYASSYEAYMTIWELLTDAFMKGEN